MEPLFHRISRFSLLNSAMVEVGMEKRRSHRLYTNLSIEYCLKFRSQTGQLFSQATMKNISQGGAYLECPNHPCLMSGQVGYLTFRSLSPYQSPVGIVNLSAKAVIRRIDSSPEGSCGVAVEFLSGPLVSYA